MRVLVPCTGARVRGWCGRAGRGAWCAPARAVVLRCRRRPWSRIRCHSAGAVKVGQGMPRASEHGRVGTGTRPVSAVGGWWVGVWAGGRDVLKPLQDHDLPERPLAEQPVLERAYSLDRHLLAVVCVLARDDHAVRALACVARRPGPCVCACARVSRRPRRGRGIGVCACARVRVKGMRVGGTQHGRATGDGRAGRQASGGAGGRADGMAGAGSCSGAIQASPRGARALAVSGQSSEAHSSPAYR